MSSIVENVKRYFKKKRENKEVPAAPEGVCPNCWGEQQWEGEYYELMKAQNITPENDTYNSFIKEFVTKHIDGIRIDNDTYTCTTCQIQYKK